MSKFTRFCLKDAANGSEQQWMFYQIGKWRYVLEASKDMFVDSKNTARRYVPVRSCHAAFPFAHR